MMPISRCGAKWPIFRKVATAEKAARPQGCARVAPGSRRNDAGLAPGHGHGLPDLPWPVVAGCESILIVSLDCIQTAGTVLFVLLREKGA